MSPVTDNPVVAPDQGLEKKPGESEPPRIRCPLCGWSPRKEDRWSCTCGNEWNTFDTGGVCQLAFTSGLRLSASLAADGRCTRIGMGSNLSVSLECRLSTATTTRVMTAISDTLAAPVEEVQMAASCSEIGMQSGSRCWGFRAGFMAACVTALAVLAVNASAQTPVPHPLLGQGWGVDHVGVGVRDLTKAQRDYEQLGFKVSEGGHFPGGLFNSIIDLENKTYLELLSVKEPQGNAASQGDAAEIADFVKKHEGAMFLGLNVSSSKVAAGYLRMQNFDVEDPNPGSIMNEGETKPPPPQWYSVSTADKPAPNKLGFSVPIFLIEYLSSEWYEEARREGRTEHPNTAIGMHAVWFAVHDLKAQLRTLRAAGFEADESRDVQLLGARGRELKAGSGTMILLESSDKTSVLQKYLSDHDEGIIALSIEVSNLSKAQRIAESVTGSKIDIYTGIYGQSFLLSPDVTHGVWLEMFQR